MKKQALLITAILLTALPALPRPITWDDMAAMRRVGAPQVSPDGKWIAYDASTIDMVANYRRSAIYLVDAAGGTSLKISDGTKRDESPVWSPDGKRIAYVSNRAATAQIYIYDIAGKSTRKVSDLHSGVSSIKWMPDSNALLAVSAVYPDCGVDPVCTSRMTGAAARKRDSARIIDSLLFRHWNEWQEATRSHIIYQPLGGSPRDLTPGAFDAPPFSVGGGDEFDVSPDGKELVFARTTDDKPALSTNSDLFVVPIAGGEARRITTRTGADTAPKYSPDGKWIAYTSQARAGYESDLWELWLYNRSTNTSSRIAADFPNWISSVAWAPDSQSFYITAPERGGIPIYEMTLGGKYTRIHNEGSAHSVTVSRDGSTIFFGLDSLRRPVEIFSLTRDGRLTQVTRDNDAIVRNVATGEVIDTTWTGADNAQVQGFIVKPPQFDATKKYPAIVFIHGGPQGAWNNAWSYRWNPQIIAARGYVVLMPNPRGSSGFGQKFVEEISGDWAGKVYTDIMNGVDMLAALPYVDGTRLGAAGGSYGGYMVNWILGHSTRFKALVSHAGVYNLESMYGVTEELWFPEWEFKGTPWDNPEQYQRWSPHRFAKNFNTPTLVSHGELDFRVPIGEGIQLFTTLQRRGVPSRFLYFPDEGHWVLKPHNSKVWFQTVGDWFDKYLK
jgi:dipeptidyl aminopeptidase/acylaminoacyl peptidase